MVGQGVVSYHVWGTGVASTTLLPLLLPPPTYNRTYDGSTIDSDPLQQRLQPPRSALDVGVKEGQHGGGSLGCSQQSGEARLLTQFKSVGGKWFGFEVAISKLILSPAAVPDILASASLTTLPG